MLIDIAKPATWPDDVRGFINELATRARAFPQVKEGFPASDLPSLFGHDGGIDEQFRTVLADRQIAMFHGSRLLLHEFGDVRRAGLQPLSEALRTSRIQGARHHHGDL